MSLNLKRWLLVGFVVAVIFAAVVAAQDDDDEDEKPIGEAGEGARITEVADGVDAEDAAEELEEEADQDAAADSLGLKAAIYFPKFPDLHVPAGQRVEMLLPITNAATNPSYEVNAILGRLYSLDYSRSLLNFSVQLYNRKVEGGETATVKYSVTPDALLEPLEYAFSVEAHLRADDNQTVVLTAFNGTIVVQEPAGFDFKGKFTLLAFFGAIAGGIYYYLGNKAAAAPAPARAGRAASPAAVETGTKDTAYDPDFVDKSHLNFLQAKNRKRSASPKK